MIQHTVAFRLRHPKGSVEEAEFLRRARELRHLPGVLDFRVLRQIGTKNRYTHALSMHFVSADAYRGYDGHPDHVAFVEGVWLPEVEEFVELDYVEMG